MPLIITKAIKEKEKITIKLDLCNDRSAGCECPDWVDWSNMYGEWVIWNAWLDCACCIGRFFEWLDCAWLIWEEGWLGDWIMQDRLH